MRLRRGSMLLRSGSKFKVQCAKGAVQVVQCCFAAFNVQSETEGPYTPKALHAPQALYTQLSSLTRCEAALPAPQVLYTRFSALNA